MLNKNVVFIFTLLILALDGFTLPNSVDKSSVYKSSSKGLTKDASTESINVAGILPVNEEENEVPQSNERVLPSTPNLGKNARDSPGSVPNSPGMSDNGIARYKRQSRIESDVNSKVTENEETNTVKEAGNDEDEEYYDYEEDDDKAPNNKESPGGRLKPGPMAGRDLPGRGPIRKHAGCFWVIMYPPKGGGGGGKGGGDGGDDPDEDSEEYRRYQKKKKNKKSQQQRRKKKKKVTSDGVTADTP
ncbi:uncharacterized protein [Periplaneta americana]|uniref:uncharacterized protein n=1 Tax=Periplaneta americana TaxID=6978 RepID=UPI0037E7C099